MIDLSLLCLVEFLYGVCCLSVDRDVAMTRVAELENTLKFESAKSKQLLDPAEQREIDLMQAEKLEVARLLSLAAHVGGKFVNFVSFAGFIILLL